MLIQNKMLRAACLTALFVLLVLVASCDPSAYKKPAEDFNKSLITLEQAFFLNIDVYAKSRLQKDELEDKYTIWTNDPNMIDLQRFVRNAEERKKRLSMFREKDLMPLRLASFNALKAYTNVLKSLASDEPTKGVTDELKGLVGEINKAMDTIESISTGSEALEIAKKYSEPLNQYIGVAIKLAELVSEVIREKAIRETIVKSNKSVKGLLKALKYDAKYTLNQTIYFNDKSLKRLAQIMEESRTNTSSQIDRVYLVEKSATLRHAQMQIKNNSILDSFDSSIEAQETLYEKAFDRDVNWVAAIRKLQAKVKEAKDSLKRVESEI